jgi:hypothetical protein
MNDKRLTKPRFDATRCISRVKLEIKEIVGKRIVGIVVKENKLAAPPRQVFLIFDDETNFEFYAGCEVTWTSGVRPGGLDWVRQYGASTYRIRLEHSENTTSAS